MDIQSIEQVFGKIPDPKAYEGGVARNVSALMMCATQLADLNVKARIARFYGRPALYVYLPWYEKEFLVATEQTERVGPMTLHKLTLELQSTKATLLAKGQDHGLAVILPALPIDKLEGNWRLKTLQMPHQETPVPILVLPNLSHYIKREYDPNRPIGMDEQVVLLETWMDEALQLSNLLARNDKRSESVINDHLEREYSQLKVLFPRQMNGKWQPGALMLALSKHCMKLSCPRIPKGMNMLIMGGTNVTHSGCSMPEYLATKLNIQIGDNILMSRRPISMPVALTVEHIHANTLELRIHPILASQLASDFDGDCADVKLIPKHIDISGLKPSVVFKQSSHTLCAPRAGWPTKADQSPSAQAATLGTMCGNKYRMGPSVTLWRMRVPAIAEFKDMSFMHLEPEMDLLNEIMHTHLTKEQFMESISGVHDAGTFFGRIFAEAVINKHQNLSTSRAKELLDMAQASPYQALKELLKSGGLFRDNKIANAAVCLYLSMLPLKFTELLETVPHMRRLLLSPSGWDIPATLTDLSVHGLADVLS